MSKRNGNEARWSTTSSSALPVDSSSLPADHRRPDGPGVSVNTAPPSVAATTHATSNNNNNHTYTAHIRLNDTLTGRIIGDLYAQARLANQLDEAKQRAAAVDGNEHEDEPTIGNTTHTTITTTTTAATTTVANPTLFRNLLTKHQRRRLMRILNRVNQQILRFNIKKLFQLWALYHPEDVNAQIVSQLIRKQTGGGCTVSVNELRDELCAKNHKAPRSATELTKETAAIMNSRLFRGEFCSRGAFADVTTTDRRRRLSADRNLWLMRLVNVKSLDRCYQFFDDQYHGAPCYHVSDLPIIKCYTEHHVDRLIEICRTATAFPLYLLPRELRAEVHALLIS